MPKSKSQTSDSPKVDGRASARGILLKSFSIEDIANKNPELYQRLLVTFKPLGIEDKPKAIYQLINDYSTWYEVKSAELEAEKLKLQSDAIEKAKKALIKQGLDPKTAFNTVA